MNSSKSQGFTLVELIVVVSIVSILVSIAIPSYFSYMASARRADAKNTILTLASYQERYHSNNGFYGSVQDLTGNVTLESDSGNYVMTVVCVPNAACTAATRPQQYTITATAQVQDLTCGNYLYNQSGAITFSVANATLDECWN